MNNEIEREAVEEQSVSKEGTRKLKSKEKLTVRDYITMALVLVLVFVVYTVVGMPMGLTIAGLLFMHAVCAILWGTFFLLLYTKVNKKGTVLIFGIVLALMQVMNFWPTSVFLAAGGVISEIIWRSMDRKKFKTMALCFTTQITFWYLGITVPLILLPNLIRFLAEDYIEMFTRLRNFSAGPMFFVGLAAVITGCIVGAFIGKLLLKKHFKKAGIV